MRRNPGVYVRGRVRHADHATITLHGWHRVLMNTEGQSKAMRNVPFLDLIQLEKNETVADSATGFLHQSHQSPKNGKIA